MSALDDDNPMTVLVVHPDDETRADLGARLVADEEVEVVDCLATASIDEVLLAMPDVLVVGAGHAEFDAAALISRTYEEAPVITVVAVLAGPDDDDGYPVLASGALSCLPVDEPDLIAAVKASWRGESRVTRGQAEAVLADFDRVVAQFDGADHAPSLTATEREVLERLAKGELSRDIADEYEVTDRLVNLHSGYAVGKVHWALDAERRLARLK